MSEPEAGELELIASLPPSLLALDSPGYDDEVGECSHLARDVYRVCDRPWCVWWVERSWPDGPSSERSAVHLSPPANSTLPVRTSFRPRPHVTTYTDEQYAEQQEEGEVGDPCPLSEQLADAWGPVERSSSSPGERERL